MESVASDLRRRDLQVAFLHTELAQWEAHVRESASNLVTMQSVVNRLTRELAERCTEVERLVIDLARKDSEVGRLVQESEEKGSQVNRLTTESAEKSGTLRRREMQIRALTAELAEKDSCQLKAAAGTRRRSHETHDTTHTVDVEQDRVHTLAGEMDTIQREAPQDQARRDSLAAEAESLHMELVRLRESATARLTEKDQELAGLRQEASAKEDVRVVEFTELNNRCRALEMSFRESSGKLQGQWEVQKAKLEGEREMSQEIAERLSEDVLKLEQCLTNERARSEALAKEVRLTLSAEDFTGGERWLPRARGFGMT